MSQPCAHVRRLTLILACLAASLLAQSRTPQASLPSAVPTMVKFSGTVPGAPGRVVGLTFALYEDQQGGAPLWLETQSVAIDAAAHYHAQLGATLAHGLPRELFASGEARWLGVQREGQAEYPRVLLLSVPYALKAADAETLGGLPASAFVLAAPGTAVPTSGSFPAIAPAPAPPPSPIVTGTGSVNFIPLWDTTSDIVNSVIFQTGSGATANVGINTPAPSVTLEVNGASMIRGALTLPTTALALAGSGKNSQPFNLSGSAFNSGTGTSVNQTFQLRTEPVGNNTANPGGKLSLLYYSGTNAAAETGLSIANNGQMTFAPGQTFPGTGAITGVTAGTGLSGGGTSGAVSLSIDTTKVPQLGTANTFSGSQTVNGNLSASGVVSASYFQIGSVLFAFGDHAKRSAYLGFGGNPGATGANNTASGYGALVSDSTGSDNTANGYLALFSNSIGFDNTATGWDALSTNTTGDDNTASGICTLCANTTGSGNTATGAGALSNNTSGNQNTASGEIALQTNTTGSNNTALGFRAGPDSAHYNLSISTAIGAFAEVTASNSLVLGSINGVNGAPADTNVGIGITAPTYRLHIGVSNNSFRVEGPATAGTNSPAASFGGYGDFGIDAPGFPQGRFVVKESGFVGIGVDAPTHIFQVGQGLGAAFADTWSTYSSRRWKTNIRTLPNALAKVEHLRGVSYDLKGSGKHEIGVIAEEVGQVVPEVVSFEANGKDAQGVDYSRLTAVLIEAVKQQQRQIAQQQRQISRLNGKVELLESSLRTTRQTRTHAARPAETSAASGGGN